MDSESVCAIIGHGPGDGAPSAPSFFEAGYRRALLSRSRRGVIQAREEFTYHC
jgi:hypothetical protein